MANDTPCSEHTHLSERVATNETKIKGLCSDSNIIFTKIDAISEKIDTVIRGRLTKGVALLITLLSSALVGLVSNILTKHYMR